MSDPRIRRLADILVHYSVDLKKGEKVLIRMIDQGIPLLKEIYRFCVRRGAYVHTDLVCSDLSGIFMETASTDQIDYFPLLNMKQAQWADAVITIVGLNNTRYMAEADSSKMAARARVLKPISAHIVNQKKWVLCNYPTQALAQDASMSLDAYENFLYSACNVDWRRMSVKQTRLKNVLDTAAQIRIKSPNTDLTFSLSGRQAVKCDGHRNMPDGEVFIAPVETSAEGFIEYDYPAIYNGKEVDNIRLVFKKGRVVEADARSNAEYLRAMLDTDAGARRLGEFGVGTNDSIRIFTKDILFDEKIGGTVHLALGRAYTQGGGRNVSAIHWDMIKDLRRGGSITADGRVIQQNGKFLI